MTSITLSILVWMIKTFQIDFHSRNRKIWTSKRKKLISRTSSPLPPTPTNTSLSSATSLWVSKSPPATILPHLRSRPNFESFAVVQKLHHTGVGSTTRRILSEIINNKQISSDIEIVSSLKISMLQLAIWLIEELVFNKLHMRKWNNSHLMTRRRPHC